MFPLAAVNREARSTALYPIRVITGRIMARRDYTLPRIIAIYNIVVESYPQEC